MTGRTESAPSNSAFANRLSSASNKPLRRSDVTVYEIDDDLLIYDPTTGDTHRLNDTARHVWQHCDGQCNLAGLAHDLTQTYEVSLDEAQQQVNRLVAELAQRRLVRPGV